MSDLMLFLDIDGVLHSWRREPKLLYRSVPIFEEALREHPKIEVVISSDRRIHESLDDLRKPFSPDIQARILGVRLSQARRIREMTQTDIARAAGLGLSMIVALEAGKQGVSLGALARVLDRIAGAAR